MAKLMTTIFMVLLGNVQVDFGMVLNSAGDGILHNGEPYYNYISYECVEGVEIGDEIMTVYRMGNSGEPDDILERYDFIIDRRGKWWE